MKYCLSLLLYSLSLSLYSGQNFQLPKNCTAVRTIYGDLDKDGRDEKVIVCNLNQTKDPKKNYKRVLYILKKTITTKISCSKRIQTFYGAVKNVDFVLKKAQIL